MKKLFVQLYYLLFGFLAISVYSCSRNGYKEMDKPNVIHIMTDDQGYRTGHFGKWHLGRFDDNLGRLREYLYGKGQEDNTILIFLTDNGSANGTRAFNAGMRGGKGSLYEGGHRVQCFIHWSSGEIGQGIDIECLTAHTYLLPTLIDLCKLNTPDRRHLQFDGCSLVPLLKNKDADWADRLILRHALQMGYHPYPRPIIGSGYDDETWLTSDDGPKSLNIRSSFFALGSEQ